MYLDDYNLSAAIDFKFTTRKSTGLPTQLAGSPAVSVYKTNSTTQTTTGVTLTVDFDSVTGLNHVRIDTSADGTFYAAGCDFAVVITAGTVDSISVVGEAVATFSILNRSALRPTTAGRTLDVSTGGEAGIDWANVGSPTTTVAFTGTTIAATQQVDVNTIKTQTVTCSAGVTVSPYVGSTGAAVNGTNVNTLASHDPGATLGTSTLTQAQVTGGAYALNSASFAFNAALDFTTTQKAATLARVTLVDTTTTNTDMITQANVRSAVGMASANLDTQIGTLATAANLAIATSYIDTEIAAIKAKTDNLPAAPAATGDCITAAGVRSAVGLASANLDTQLAAIDDYIDTEIAAIKVTTDRLETTWALNSGSYRFTAAALALGPSGSTSVTINPYTATVSGGAVSDSGKLTAYQYADFGPFTITVVDADGDPVALNASDLVFVAFDPDGDGTSALFRITGTSGDITVGGAGSNVVTIHQDDTNTSTAMVYSSESPP